MPHVLIVDDSDAMQVVLRISLTRLGVSVDIASNGCEAIEQYLKNNYSLILMDVDMPIMSGFEATQAIRAHEAEHNKKPIPIVAITAGVTTEAQCLAAGMSDFAQKPILIEMLKSLLAKWIQP